MNAPAEDIFDIEDIQQGERATLGERVSLRPDLKDCKTLRGWAGRANRENLPLLRVNDFSDFTTIGTTEIGFVQTQYARSTMDNRESVTGRKTHHTDLELTEKECLLCPNCGVGFIHPKTWMCNGGHATESRCGTQQPNATEVVIRSDVANRYEPKVKGMPVCDINEEGSIVLIGVQTLTRRGGSDKAQNNPEKWMTARRFVKGAKPSWGAGNVEGDQFNCGLVGVTDKDGRRASMTIAFPQTRKAAFVERGVTMTSKGVNLFDREVTE